MFLYEYSNLSFLRSDESLLKEAEFSRLCYKRPEKGKKGHTEMWWIGITRLFFN